VAKYLSESPVWIKASCAPFGPSDATLFDLHAKSVAIVFPGGRAPRLSIRIEVANASSPESGKVTVKVWDSTWMEAAEWKRIVPSLGDDVSSRLRTVPWECFLTEEAIKLIRPIAGPPPPSTDFLLMLPNDWDSAE